MPMNLYMDDIDDSLIEVQKVLTEFVAWAIKVTWDLM